MASVGGPTGPGSATPVAGKPLAPPTVALRSGDKGPPVLQLQTALVKLGFLSQVDLGKEAGKFGAPTAQALKKFQAEQHLPVSGGYGVAERIALGKALQALASPKPKLEATLKSAAFQAMGGVSSFDPIPDARARLKQAGTKVGLQSDGWRPSFDDPFGPIHSAADAGRSGALDLNTYESTNSLSAVANHAATKVRSLMAATQSSGAHLFRTQIDAKFLPPASVAKAYNLYADATATPTIAGFKAWMGEQKPSAQGLSAQELSQATAELRKASAPGDGPRTNLDAQLVYAAEVRGECQALRDAPAGLSTDVVIGLDGADRHLEEDQEQVIADRRNRWTASHVQNGMVNPTDTDQLRDVKWTPDLMSQGAKDYATALNDKAVFLAHQLAGAGAQRVELGNELNQPDKAFRNGYDPNSLAPDGFQNIGRRVGWLQGVLYQAIKKDPACQKLTVDATSTLFTHGQGRPGLDPKKWETPISSDDRGYLEALQHEYATTTDDKREAVVDEMWRLYGKYNPTRDGAPSNTDAVAFLKQVQQIQQENGLLSQGKTGHIASDELNLHFYGSGTEDARLIGELAQASASGPFQGMLPSQVFVSEVGCRGEQVGVPQEERIAEQISVIAQALKDNGFQLKALSLFAEEATDGLWSLNDASLPGKLSG